MHLWIINHLSFSFFITLALSSVLYFLSPQRWRLSIISGVTFLFFLLAAPLSCLWLSLSTLTVVWGLKQKRCKTALWIIALSTVFLLSQWINHPTSLSVLPNSIAFLGIAYYTCRHIHVLVEAHKGKITGISLRDYIHYSFFLPAMMNGPIHRYPQFIRTCQRRTFEWKDIFQGLERILYGYAKIILIGNYFLNFKLLNWLNAHDLHGFILILLHSSIDWLALYAVFSGYTDVAVGFAKLWGFTLEENFNYPLKARNLIEFWQRWHITLSLWCKDYIYLPVLAYSRSAVLGVIFAMIGIGIWHQFSLYYLLWACYQALGIILCRLYQRHDPLHLKKLPNRLRYLITWIATFSWLFFAKAVITLLLTSTGLSQ